MRCVVSTNDYRKALQEVDQCSFKQTVIFEEVKLEINLGSVRFRIIRENREISLVDEIICLLI